MAEGRGKPIVIRPTESLRRRVDEYCCRTGMFLAELTRRALDEYLAKREKKGNPRPINASKKS